MGKVVHFEIPADDLDRARTFYGKVFGWRIDTMPMPGGGEYTGLTTTAVDEKTMTPTEPGAINGGMMQRDAATPAPVITIDVEDIDAALAKIEELGGMAVLGRQAVGEMGWAAYFKDVEGNLMGLWQGRQG